MDDYFTLLGLPRDFAIDSSQLEQRYFSLQRQYHPDRAVNTSPQDKQHMLKQSGDINTAYNTLKHPLSRARHLLALQGLAMDGKPPANVLAEAMEWREALEEAADIKAIEPLYRRAFKEREACLEALGDEFEEKDFATAAQECARLAYLEKLLEELQQKHSVMKGTA